MTRKRAFTGFLSVLTIASLAAASCQNGSSRVSESAPQPGPESPAAQPSRSVVLDLPAGPPAPELPAAAAAPEDKVSLASNTETTAGAGNTPPSKETKSKSAAADKPKIEIKSPYTETNPTLLGLTLKTGADEITGKFGKPKETFVMEDDADPITVYDYTDFLIGFNGQNQLHFVDVRSGDVNPGLNGLKLGDPVANVYEALGKPDANTTYVLTYKATGAILKLDIDPKTQKVNSIKLFAE
ncbi:DUF4309 domain-containing protein [Paenibacillus caseinilyticus]|uniref:DUF4309 domain-containing protein n=1 Tax=Paenibacillus caseinilyticus TaxID=3098138 RepID=UPI0022B8FDB2|nr:DUF4309 domain-containing protein [Paenibacillus caseinilyticus]MCZ8517985.1 DUF4309 domain-containing protein [Paenibacillus caseinilyticus]